MSSEASTPAATVLRKLASSIASDAALAPVRSANHQRLGRLTSQFVALEKTMTATSDMVERAEKHADVLAGEAAKWDSLVEGGEGLIAMLDAARAGISPISPPPAAHVAELSDSPSCQ